MQTFLPYESFEKSAEVLDNKRLGKQRVECLQILQVLKKGDKAKGWKNHPAVKMWKGHETWLISYGVSICDEWIQRGFKDSCRVKIENLVNYSKISSYPPWLGNRKFHTSHKSNLLRKDITHYSKFFKCKEDYPYVWPTNN